MSAIDSPQRKLRPLIHSWFFAKSKDMPVPILSDLLLCPKTRVESPGVLQCSRWLNLLLTNATPKLVLERKLELANFKRTKKKATMVNDAQSKAILVPAEILVLIFEKLYEQTQIIRQLRLISRQFEALVSPLVFRNVRLDDQLGVHLGNMGVPGATPALQRTAIYVMKYARNVTISSLNAVPNYTANAIRRMKCFRLLRLEFLERTCMNGDGVAFSLLRDCFLDFEVVIESETDQMTLTYEARGSPRPELRSIEVDIGKRVIFADFGVDIAEWDTLETLTINGYLRMDPTKSWCNLRTLKMDSRSDKRSFQKPMSSIQMLELNGWFPNLEYLELNIPQRESFVRHHEATAFLESLAAFRNLRYLNLKANPFLVEGSICGVLPGAQSMWSMTECLHIVDVSPRGAAYKARATGMAMNIFKTLLREKQGTLFGELRLSIDARLHGDCEHCLYSVSPENRHCMTTCVPAVSCEWRGHYQTTGEPLVRIECDMDDECVECPRRISMQLLPTTQGSVFDSW